MNVTKSGSGNPGRAFSACKHYRVAFGIRDRDREFQNIIARHGSVFDWARCQVFDSGFMTITSIVVLTASGRPVSLPSSVAVKVT